MDWAVNYLEECGIVFVKLLSPMKVEEFKPLSKEMLSLAREHNSHRYLVDHRSVDTGVYVSDIDGLADIAKDVGIDPDNKVAVLVGLSIPQRFKLDFAQKVLSLVSIRINFFYDKDEAIAWLISEK